MSSIEAASKEMATLSDSIKMYEKFPTREDDEKSSDEESFHLPIDDEEAEKRDMTLNGHNESEDDILDKFEDANGPEIDPQLEERLLEDTDETSKAIIDKSEKTSSEEQNSETVSKSDSSKLVSEDVEKSDKKPDEENEDLKNDVEVNNETKNIKNIEDKENIEKDPKVEDLKEDVKVNNETKNIKNIEDKENIEKDTKVEDEISETKENKNDEKNCTDNDEKPKTPEECEKGVEDIKKTEEESKQTDVQEDVEMTEKTEESSEKIETKVAEPEKCENSNDSSKNSESDLLDICIIRDVEEDDENAREEHAKDVAVETDKVVTEEEESFDKVVNEEEESCDKVSESADDVDNDHQEVVEKDEPVVFDEEFTSKEEDTTATENEEKQPEDKVETEEEEADKTLTEAEVQTDTTSEVEDASVSTNVEPMEDGSQTEEILEEKNDEAKENEVVNENGDNDLESEDQSREIESTIKSAKRSLSEADSDIASKKIKLADSDKENQTSVDTEIDTPLPPEEPTILSSFANFMKCKKVSTKLSRADLEQFCLQKICEAIIHKTDVGDLHQKIKQYEGTIDQLRKDVTQLTKQARDLEIVNKKLMNELKVQNGNKKPLVPLKITRSVGLQVKLNFVPENTRKRLSTNNSPQKPGNTPGSKIARPNQSNARQVSSPSKNILSQALQPRRSGVATPVNQKQQPQKRPGPQPRAKASEPKSASVIDLTDEDAPQKARLMPLGQMQTVTFTQNNQTKTIPLRIPSNQQKGANVPQGMRVTPSQLKNGSIALPGVVTSSAPLMYVVQPTASLTTAGGQLSRPLLVNFQAANLTNAINGSTVSVVPKTTPQQTKTVNPRKHPAPLPMAPFVKVAGSSFLKPIPPKPHLSIRKTDTGIMLQWKMPYSLDNYEAIASYQLYAYQETNSLPSSDMWRRVGDVKALALPMACTLVQFADKNKYYFAVRSVDVHKRIGPFSDPEEISL